MTMILFTLILVLLIGVSIALGVTWKSSDWFEIVWAAVLIVALSFCIICKAYELRHPREKPVWGVVDSTLIIGTNQFEVEVCVKPDGSLHYRKGKKK